MTRFTQVALASAVVGALAFPAQAAQRAYVASYGSDANAGAGCLLNAPCRGFTAAMGAVDAGGEIVALDAAGYGAVAITKSVTITANPGYFAGIAASSGTAVTIATAGVSVILRGLNINGIGASRGVHMTAGSKLSIENSVLSNFGAQAVEVNANALVNISDTLIRDNGNGILLQGGSKSSISRVQVMNSSSRGILVDGNVMGTLTGANVSDSVVAGGGFIAIQAYSTGGDSRLQVTRTTASGHSYGIIADSGTLGAVVTVDNCLVVNNTTSGFKQDGSSTLYTRGNNTERDNASLITGAFTPLSGV